MLPATGCWRVERTSWRRRHARRGVILILCCSFAPPADAETARYVPRTLCGTSPLHALTRSSIGSHCPALMHVLRARRQRICRFPRRGLSSHTWDTLAASHRGTPRNAERACLDYAQCAALHLRGAAPKGGRETARRRTPWSSCLAIALDASVALHGFAFSAEPLVRLRRGKHPPAAVSRLLNARRERSRVMQHNPARRELKPDLDVTPIARSVRPDRPETQPAQYKNGENGRAPGAAPSTCRTSEGQGASERRGRAARHL